MQRENDPSWHRMEPCLVAQKALLSPSHFGKPVEQAAFSQPPRIAHPCPNQQMNALARKRHSRLDKLFLPTAPQSGACIFMVGLAANRANGRSALCMAWVAVGMAPSPEDARSWWSTQGRTGGSQDGPRPEHPISAEQCNCLPIELEPFGPWIFHHGRYVHEYPL